MVYQQIVRQWDLLSEESFGLFVEARLNFGAEWAAEDNDRTKSFKQFPQFDFKISRTLKQNARYGIPHKQRRRWWLTASNGLKLLTQVGDVWKSAKKSASSIKSRPNDSKFGGCVDILTFLPPAISRKLNQFLHVLWTQNQGIDFSPLIPTVSALLLLYMEVPLAYITIQSMINISRQDSWYFTLTTEQFLASVQAFGELVKTRCPSIAHHAESLNLNIAQIGLSLFPVFFLPFMPLPVALTLFDSFMIEGRKVLYRFCLNLLIQEKKNLLSSTTAQSFISVLVNAMERLHDISILKLFLRSSFKIFLSRSRHMNQVEAHALASRSGLVGGQYQSELSGPIIHIGSSPPKINLNNLNNPYNANNNSPNNDNNENSFSNDANDNNFCPNGNNSMIMPTNSLPLEHSLSGDRLTSATETAPFPGSFPSHTPIDLFSWVSPSNENSSLNMFMMQQHIVNRILPEIVGGRLLTDALYYQLRQNLPTVLTRYSVNLVYAMSINGNSFNELFNACRDETPYILLIKTTSGVFGAMLSDPPRPDKSPGEGKYFGKPVCFVFNATTQEVYYPQPPPNNMFMCADEKALIVGGPVPAIALRGQMKVMESGPCETYGSPGFCTAEEGDQVVEVELYTLVTISIRAPPTK